jgi:hypothetical protein
MDSHDIIKQLLTEVSAKQVADQLGVSLSLVYKWAESPLLGSGTSNPLDRAETLIRLSTDKLALRWICERMGGYFAPVPAPGADAAASTGKAIAELGTVIGELCRLLEKGKHSHTSTRGLRTHWERAKSLMEGYILAAEKEMSANLPPPEKANRPQASPIKNSLKMIPSNHTKTLCPPASLPASHTGSRQK